MTSRDFCFWLQGFFEVTNHEEGCYSLPLTKEQVGIVRRHLALVFQHEIDPSMGPPSKQDLMNALHNSGKMKPTDTGHVFDPPVGGGPIMRC